MPKKPNGLRRRGNVWEYRKVVPNDVRGIIGKTEIIRSLQTSDYKAALLKHPIVMIEVRNWIAAARRQRPQTKSPTKESITSLSPEEMSCITMVWFYKLEQSSLTLRSSLKKLPPDEKDELERNFMHDITALDQEDLPYDDNMYLTDWAKKETTELLKAHSIQLPQGSAEFKQIKSLVSRGLIENITRTLNLLKGEGEKKTDVFFDEVDSYKPLPESVRKGIPSERVTVVQLLEKYCREGRRGKIPRERTIAQYRVQVGRFVEFIGKDQSIESISRDDFINYRDLLRRIPSNATKHFPGKTYQEIVDLPQAIPLPKMSARTISKNIETLSMIFGYGEKYGLIKSNHAQNIPTLQQTESPQRGRKSFSVEQLQKIFSAPLYTGCVDDRSNYSKVGTNVLKHARYWVPLIALFTGMRLNEICQLYVEDIKDADGFSYIVIRTTRDDGSTAKDKRLKNASAFRSVPIHPELQAMGFLQYVNTIRDKQSERLFPELKYVNDGYSDHFQKWFSRFLHSLGLKSMGRQICFHTFRHTFRDATRNAGMVTDHYNRLCGWVETKSEGSEYGDGAAEAVLYEQISKVSYTGLDLSHLKQ